MARGALGAVEVAADPVEGLGHAAADGEVAARLGGGAVLALAFGGGGFERDERVLHALGHDGQAVGLMRGDALARQAAGQDHGPLAHEEEHAHEDAAALEAAADVARQLGGFEEGLRDEELRVLLGQLHEGLVVRRGGAATEEAVHRAVVLDGLDDHVALALHDVEGLVGVAEIKGFHRLEQRFLAQVVGDDAVGVAQHRAVVRHAGPERVEDLHVALPRAVNQPGHAVEVLLRHGHGVHRGALDTAVDDVHLLKAADGFQVYMAVAHEEVTGAGEGDTHVAGEEAFLEKGLAGLAPGQQHDARALDPGDGAERFQELRGEGRHRADGHATEELREGLREHAAVLYHEREAEGRRHVVFQYQPASAGLADEVHRTTEAVLPAGREEADKLPVKGRVCQYDAMRHDLVTQDCLLVVDVADVGVEGAGTLQHAGGDALPFLHRDDAREEVELPIALGSGVVLELAEVQAELHGGAVQAGLAQLQLVVAQAVDGADSPGISMADAPAVVPRFVALALVVLKVVALLFAVFNRHAPNEGALDKRLAIMRQQNRLNQMSLPHLGQ